MESIKNFTLKMDRNAQVISVLSSNAEIWNKVSKFQIAVDQLISNQKKLVDFHSLLSKDISTIENDKNDRRTELEDRTIAVVRIMQVFAHDKKIGKLQQKLYHLNYEYAQNCLDLELIAISKKIFLIANKFGGYALTFKSKIKSALNPDNIKATNKFEKQFGLNHEMIKNLEDAIINFIKAMLLHKVEMDEKEKVALKMKEINKKTKKLLTNKIDRFVLLFENKNPGFYKEYHDLRDKQLQKPVKESSDQETNLINILAEEIPVIPVKPILKPKTPRRSNTVKK